MITDISDFHKIFQKSLLVLVLLTTSCIMIDIELQLPDQTVKPLLIGKDCVGIYLGFGFGTVKMSEALLSRKYEERQGTFSYEAVRLPDAHIRRIHSVLLKDQTMFAFGQRCLEIKGEP